MDNFSRYITSWRMADKVCAKVRIETFEETIINAGIEPNQKEKTELIVDGGTENNNKAVTTLLQKYPVDKLVAMKDILKSNSMIESLNKIIKYDYLYPRNIHDQEELVKIMRKDCSSRLQRQKTTRTTIRTHTSRGLREKDCEL
jgi:transposase InsO family protein